MTLAKPSNVKIADGLQDTPLYESSVAAQQVDIGGVRDNAIDPQLTALVPPSTVIAEVKTGEDEIRAAEGNKVARTKAVIAEASPKPDVVPKATGPGVFVPTTPTTEASLAAGIHTPACTPAHTVVSSPLTPASAVATTLRLQTKLVRLLKTVRIPPNYLRPSRISRLVYPLLRHVPPEPILLSKHPPKKNRLKIFLVRPFGW